VLKRAFLAATIWMVGTAGAFAAPVDLTILHTNDTHDRLLPFDSRNGKDLGGIARRAALIKQIKSQTAGTLVLDAGDVFQGTPIYTFYLGEADYKAMDQAGYDATTVGNHELDNGLANLLKQMQGRSFKIINSNMQDRDGKNIFMRKHVFERNGLKIGVFGILGEDAHGAVAKKYQQDYVLLPPVKVAQELVHELRKEADLVVMLSHSGLEEDTDLAKQVKGIDLIVGGHSHTKLDVPREVMNGDWRTLVVQGFQWGEYLGRLDLKVDNGRIVSYDGKLLPITNALQEDKIVAETVESYNAKIAKEMAVVVAQAPKGLSSEGKYQGDSPLGNWTADMLKSISGADVGIVNSGGLRASFHPGNVTVGDVYSVFPFDNAVVTVDMPGKLMQQMLDTTASYLGGSGFLQFSGVTFRIDGKKAKDVLVNGKPLDPKRTYKVATIDYVAQGGDRQPHFAEASNYQGQGVLLRDAVLDYLRKNPTITVPATGRIKVPASKAPNRVRD